MVGYDISTNAVEIISGTTNHTSTAYVEASKSISEDSSKSLKYLKNFITSIEELQTKSSVKDERISSSKGNIKEFSGYENIQKSREFIKKYGSGIKEMKYIDDIIDALDKYQNQYQDGYTQNISLVKAEYESAVYLVVTGLAMVLATNLDVVSNGGSIKVVKKSKSTGGSISKILKEFSGQVSKSFHKEYLEYMIKAKDEVGVSSNISESTTYLESVVADSIALVSALFHNTGIIIKHGAHFVTTLKNTLFGIVPLIRSVMYLKCNKKVDTIRELEQNVVFIQQNIERLEKRTNIPEAEKRLIIKKQQAAIEAYQKKAEKLRAQLMEGEKEATVEIKKEDPKMSVTSEDDGDFVLEGTNLSNFMRRQ